MKNVLIITAAMAAFATSASAWEVGATGISLNNEVVAAYTVDAADMTTVWTPTLSYAISSVGLSASTDLSVWNNGWTGDTTLKTKPTIDLEADYAVNETLGLTAKVSYNLEAAAKRSDITLEATFNF
jgi:hypothetical protein